jgi:glycosyltransferase involved in cell wall biosynthesis
VNLLFLNSAPVWGGNEKWVSMAMSALAPLHGVHLAYRHQVVGRNIGLSKTRLPFLAPVDPYTIWRLSRMIHRLGVSVLIPTKPADVIAAGIAGRLCGVPTLARLGIVRRLGPYRRFVYETMADGVVVNASIIKQILESDGYSRAERIHVIRNGLDVHALEDALRKPAPIAPRQWTVACTGSMIDDRKGFDTLLRGFSHFRALAGPGDVRLVLIGDGPHRPFLESLARDLGIAPFTDFLGHIANPYPRMAASDVFVLCSRNEGMPNSLIEAMYLQNAVIATAVGGIGEVIAHGQNGFLVQLDDWRAVGHHLVSLHRDARLLHELKTRAHETARDGFCTTRMGRQLAEVCADLVESSGRHRRSRPHHFDA